VVALDKCSVEAWEEEWELNQQLQDSGNNKTQLEEYSEVVEEANLAQGCISHSDKMHLNLVACLGNHLLGVSKTKTSLHRLVSQLSSNNNHSLVLNNLNKYLDLEELLNLVVCLDNNLNSNSSHNNNNNLVSQTSSSNSNLSVNSNNLEVDLELHLFLVIKPNSNLNQQVVKDFRLRVFLSQL